MQSTQHGLIKKCTRQVKEIVDSINEALRGTSAWWCHQMGTFSVLLIHIQLTEWKSMVHEIGHCVLGRERDLAWPDWLNWWARPWVAAFAIHFFSIAYLSGKHGVRQSTMNAISRFQAFCLDMHMKLALYKYAIVYIHYSRWSFRTNQTLIRDQVKQADVLNKSSQNLYRNKNTASSREGMIEIRCTNGIPINDLSLDELLWSMMDCFIGR